MFAQQNVDFHCISFLSLSLSDTYYTHKCTAALITDSYLLVSSYCSKDLAGKGKQYAAVGGSDRRLTHIYLTASNYRLVKGYLTQDSDPSPRQYAVVKHSIAIAILESPFVLGSQTNIYLACLFERESADFKNDLLVASYGETSDRTPGSDIEVKVGEVNHIFSSQPNLWMASMKQFPDCAKIISNFNSTNEICVESKTSALVTGDAGK